MDPSAAHPLNLLLRGATVGVLLLVAARLWHGPRHARTTLRLGAAFAVGVAAATLSALPGVGARPWLAPIGALAAGSMFVFWLFTRALLADDFRLRPWHAAVWLALTAAGVANCLIGPQPALGVWLAAMPVVWALLAIGQSLASWRADLVEGRRRLRTLVVAATALYTVGQLLAAWLGGIALHDVVASAWNAAGTAALTLYLSWRLLRVDAAELVGVEPAQTAHLTAEPSTASATSPVDPPDPRQLATLERLMTVERLYREPSLTIAALARRMGLPEHRLRRLINQGLGQRNFNAYLNGHRIADAKRALRDAGRADEPILTIAMDVGFQSIGPFNRAFKADTGMTPTEYRRAPTPAPRATAEIA